MVAQALGGVVNIVLVAFDTFAMALAKESPEQAVVRQRLAGIAATATLGLSQALDDQVVAGFVLVVLLQQRQFFAGGFAGVQGFLAEPAAAVVAQACAALGQVGVGGELAGDLSTVYFLRINLSYFVHFRYLSGSA